MNNTLVMNMRVQIFFKPLGKLCGHFSSSPALGLRQGIDPQVSDTPHIVRFVLCAFALNVLMQNLVALPHPADNSFWEMQYENRPEFVLNNNSRFFADKNTMIQGVLYDFPQSSSLKMGLGGEYRHISGLDKSDSSHTGALRLRLNQVNSSRNLYFLDMSVFSNKNLSMNAGFSWSTGRLYSSFFYEIHTLDWEVPDTWLGGKGSMGAGIFLSYTVLDKMYLSVYGNQKIFDWTESDLRVMRWTTGQSLDIYILGRPGIVVPRLFDQYQDMLPYSYNRSIIFSLGNEYESFNNDQVNTQSLRLSASIPLRLNFGVAGSVYSGANLLKFVDRQSSYLGAEAGVFTSMSRRTGLFVLWNVYNASSIGYNSSYQGLNVSVHCNL
ncbi:MAG: hypothetical protein HQK83_09375 [Fibrobacteria bacterium]|nr:hypothetical protein [Fibrobacteria bacterium]